MTGHQALITPTSLEAMQVIDVADTEPIYALLLCRQTQTILMKNTLEIIPENADPKEVLTLGDADAKKLNLKKHFTQVQQATIQMRSTSTNPLYIIGEPKKVPSKRQINEVDY